MTDRILLLESVEKTVDGLATVDVDAAIVHLAQLYADEVDTAAAWRARADRAARKVREEHGDESALYEEVEALRAKLSERTALLALGKQLQSALVELGATPRSRAAKSGTPNGAAPSTLTMFRQNNGLSA